MNIKFSLPVVAVTGAMLIVVMGGLLPHVNEPYIGLFLGQFVFFAVASNVLLAQSIGSRLNFLQGMRASGTLILVFILQLVLAWLAFGLFFYATHSIGFPDQKSLLLDGHLRNALVIQQTAVVVWAVIAQWSTKRIDRTVAIVLALIGLLLVLPNFR